MNADTFYVICDVHTGAFVLDIMSGNTTNLFHAMRYESLEYAQSLLAKYPDDFRKNYVVKKVYFEVTDP